MADPATIGAAAGAFLMAVGAFVKIFKSEQKSKSRDNEVLDALKIVKDIFQPTNGKDKGTMKSDGIPGFAPECLQRAKDHGERIATAEADIGALNSRFQDQDRRFDGLNQKIESVRSDMKGEFAELRKEIRGQA
jgi:hypothetical protein